MSRYVTYPMGAEEPAKAPDMAGKTAAEIAASRFKYLSNQALVLRQAIESKTWTGAKAAEAKTLSSRIDGLYKRLIEWHKSIIKGDMETYQKWALLGTGVLVNPIVLLGFGFKGIGEMVSGGKLDHMGAELLNQTLQFELEVAKLCEVVQKFTGFPVMNCKRLPPPKVPKKRSDELLDFLWGTVKVGGVVLGGWLLYQYLEKQTRYPADRLPRYAGGRRKTHRRKRR